MFVILKESQDKKDISPLLSGIAAIFFFALSWLNTGKWWKNNAAIENTPISLFHVCAWNFVLKPLECWAKHFQNGGNFFSLNSLHVWDVSIPLYLPNSI